MKELRRHQSGWVITVLVAMRNDWQSKLILPRGGGEEFARSRKCIPFSFYETSLLIASLLLPRSVVRFGFFFHHLQLTLFPNIFLRRRFYFPRLPRRHIRLLPFFEERSSSSRKSQLPLCLDNRAVDIRAVPHVRGMEL